LNRPSFKLQPEGAKVATADVADNVSIGRLTHVIDSGMSDVLQRSHLAGPPSIGELKGGARGHNRAVHLSRKSQGRNVCDVHHEQHARQYGLYHDAPISGLRQGLVLMRGACASRQPIGQNFEVFYDEAKK
jgi:hypothetical protein